MRTSMLLILVLWLAPGAARADQVAFRADPADGRVVAPAPWSHQDPADSLYRAAREAMNRGDHDRSARLFRQVWDRYPRSTYAPDAPYWEAFNRYRLGEMEDLHEAQRVLRRQAERYPEASTLKNGDAPALSARIRGMLARRGDEAAAQSIVVAANEIAGVGARIGVEVAAQMEVLAEEMAARGELMGEELAAVAAHGAAIAEGLTAGLGSRGNGIPEQCRAQAETQLSALNALLHMKADRALPVLKRVMARRDECSVHLRRRAVFMVAEKGGSESVDVLLAAARSDPDVEVRRQAVFWLSEVDDPRAVTALERFLNESEDDQVRERAIFALSQHDHPRARQILRNVARDAGMPDRLRSKAIFWLGSQGTAEDLDFVKELFGTLDDPALDERILFAVGQAERGRDARWLLGVAADRGVAMKLRRTAVFWAAETGAPASELGALYDRVQDRKLKERVLFGLSQSSQPAAIDKLIEIARSEQDAELRKRAIFWIGNSNDPRAADVLMELLAGPGGDR